MGFTLTESDELNKKKIEYSIKAGPWIRDIFNLLQKIQ